MHADCLLALPVATIHMNQIIHTYSSQAELNKAVKLWQKRLALQDWTISATFVRASEFGNPLQVGGCDPYVRNSAAYIAILDEGDYDDNYGDPYDAEEILVHELVHLLMARLVSALPPDVDDLDEEIVVNKLTAALIKAYRCR